jgi:hypothetical protein
LIVCVLLAAHSSCRAAAILRVVLKRSITRSEAQAIARTHADARGWPWTEPVTVHRAFRAWRVCTNTGSRGGNVRVRVDAFSGEVRRSGFAPR